jgi:hypothetical protein
MMTMAIEVGPFRVAPETGKLGWYVLTYTHPNPAEAGTFPPVRLRPDEIDTLAKLFSSWVGEAHMARLREGEEG